MKYRVQKYPDGRFICVRISDGRSIKLKPIIDWLHIDPKSAETYFDHEFHKKHNLPQ